MEEAMAVSLAWGLPWKQLHAKAGMWMQQRGRWLWNQHELLQTEVHPRPHHSPFPHRRRRIQPEWSVVKVLENRSLQRPKVACPRCPKGRTRSPIESARSVIIQWHADQ